MFNAAITRRRVNHIPALPAVSPGGTRVVGIDYRNVPGGFQFDQPEPFSYQLGQWDGNANSNILRTDGWTPRWSGKGIVNQVAVQQSATPLLGCSAANDVVVGGGIGRPRGGVAMRFGFLLELAPDFWDIVDDPGAGGIHSNLTLPGATGSWADWINIAQFKDWGDPLVGAWFIKSAPNRQIHFRVENHRGYVSNGLMSSRGDGRLYQLDLRFKLEGHPDDTPYPGTGKGYWIATVNGQIVHLVDHIATCNPSGYGAIEPTYDPADDGAVRGPYVMLYVGHKGTDGTGSRAWAAPLRCLYHNFYFETDPGCYLNHSKLFLDCEGLDGGTTLVDRSNGFVMSLVGGAITDFTEHRFGASSLYIPSGSAAVPAGAESTLSPGTGDFTVEFWVNFETLNAANQFMVDTRGSTVVNAGRMIFWKNNLNEFRFSAGAAWSATASVVPETGRWYHVALCRSGTTTRWFIDGALQHTQANDTVNYQFDAGRPIFGAFRTGAQEHLLGYLDGIRILHAARYTEPFTPLNFI